MEIKTGFRFNHAASNGSRQNVEEERKNTVPELRGGGAAPSELHWEFTQGADSLIAPCCLDCAWRMLYGERGKNFRSRAFNTTLIGVFIDSIILITQEAEVLILSSDSDGEQSAISEVSSRICRDNRTNVQTSSLLTSLTPLSGN